MIVPHCRV